MEDDLTFFANGRQPLVNGRGRHFFVNERQPLVFQRKGKLQMEDDLNFFCKWKITSYLLQMEDDLIFV